MQAAHLAHAGRHVSPHNERANAGGVSKQLVARGSCGRVGVGIQLGEGNQLIRASRTTVASTPATDACRP